MSDRANCSFVVWASCFLWLTSFFAIAWSIVLFYCIGDVLYLTGADLVVAFVLLSGMIMLPTNVYMLYAVANGKKIDHKATIVCCPLWCCVIWIIIINFIGAVLCLHKIFCTETTANEVLHGMKHYRNIAKYKRFMDTIQWSLKCCGLNSYQDWFHYDWYDRIRDYEWDPTANKRAMSNKKNTFTDSVPLSCCKSGSCISNYLTELGTSSINTSGCGKLLQRIQLAFMSGLFIMFFTIVAIEILLLKCIMRKDKDVATCNAKEKDNVKLIMSVNDRFDETSGSCENNDDSDFEDNVSY